LLVNADTASPLRRETPGFRATPTRFNVVSFVRRGARISQIFMVLCRRNRFSGRKICCNSHYERNLPHAGCRWPHGVHNISTGRHSALAYAPLLEEEELLTLPPPITAQKTASAAAKQFRALRPLA
jgi:hypothetical protein